MKKRMIISVLLFSFSFAEAQNDIRNQMIVAQDGSGDFTGIQEAIDATKAFPPEPVAIIIKNGVYHEKVRIPSWNTTLSLIGEDVEKTRIIWDDYFGKIDRGRNSTFFTYTMIVEADDFYAENITVENSAGQVGQAVAIHVEGNRCRFNNCQFLGNQDTAYLDGENSVQLFTNCTITGTTDFIFGSATVVFKECTIVSKRDSYITAASTARGKEFGFVFFNCKLEAAENVNKVFLGRPWRPYAKTVFIECELGQHICAEGWQQWSNADNLTATFYAEYKNHGAGASTDKRVEWAHQLTREEAQKYTLENILGAWNPE
ncbi:pectin esterase [bacterium]|nr:pectin esterase [bacterium]